MTTSKLLFLTRPTRQPDYVFVDHNPLVGNVNFWFDEMLAEDEKDDNRLGSRVCKVAVNPEQELFNQTLGDNYIYCQEIQVKYQHWLAERAMMEDL